MITIKELRTMTSEDLRTEIRDQETAVLKLRLGVKLGKEKDSAKYIRERKQLARMKTIATEKQGKQERHEKQGMDVDSSISPVSHVSLVSSKKKSVSSAKIPKK